MNLTKKIILTRSFKRSRSN